VHDHDLADVPIGRRHIGGLAGGRNGKGEISEIPEYRHRRIGEGERAILLRNAVEQIGVMRREHGGNQKPGIHQRECRERDVRDPPRARHLFEGRQWFDDGDHAQQRGNHHDGENELGGFVLFDIPGADALGAQSHHPRVDQPQEQDDTAIPAHQNAGDHRPVRQKKENRGAGGERDPHSRVVSKQLVHDVWRRIHGNREMRSLNVIAGRRANAA